MSAQTRRGRATPRRKKTSLVPMLLLIGIVAVLGISLVAVNLSRATSGPIASGSSNLDVASLGSYPSKGNADAPVTVVEFGDYQCPGCAYYANNLASQIDQEYIDSGKIRFIFHELPISSHALAYPAAQAARLAGDQGKFWEMHELLFARQQEWTNLPSEQAVTKFATYAQELGLDVDAFNQGMQSDKYREAIDQAYQGAISANIQSTPSFVINGKIYQQDGLKAAIDSALAAQ